MTSNEIMQQALQPFEDAKNTKLSWGQASGMVRLQRAYRDFMVETKLWYGTVGTTTTASTRLYALSTAMFQMVNVRHAGQVLAKTNMEELSADAQWLTRDGTPSSWYIGENFNQIGLYPIPTAGEGGTLVASGYRYNSSIPTGTSTLSILPEYEWAVVDRLRMFYLETHPEEPNWDKHYALAQADYRQHVERAKRLNMPSTPRAIVHPDWARR